MAMFSASSAGSMAVISTNVILSKAIQLLSAVKLAVTYYISDTITFLCCSLGEVRYSTVVQSMIILYIGATYPELSVGTSIHHIPLATCTSLMHALASTTSSPRGSTG